MVAARGAPVLVVAADGDPERVGPVVVAGASDDARRRSVRGLAPVVLPVRVGAVLARGPLAQVADHVVDAGGACPRRFEADGLCRVIPPTIDSPLRRRRVVAPGVPP